jgi:RNA polymerase sigma factor (sigma-70 family)
VEGPDRIVAIVERERARLRNFVRRRVPNAQDVEDILQDVFFELVEANRRLMPIDHVTGWLFQVARNRITDLFRRRQPERLGDAVVVADDGEVMRVADLPVVFCSAASAAAAGIAAIPADVVVSGGRSVAGGTDSRPRRTR